MVRASSELESESELSCTSKESWEIFSFFSQHRHQHMSDNMAQTQIPAQTPAPKETQGAGTMSVEQSKEEEWRARREALLAQVGQSIDMVLVKRQVEDAAEESDHREGPSAPKKVQGGKCLRCEWLELECVLQNK